MAKLVFLGRLEDIAGAGEIALPLAQGTALADVLQRLAPELRTALQSPKIRIAVNGQVIGAEQAPEELMIADTDEVAFLPPVSGG